MRYGYRSHTSHYPFHNPVGVGRWLGFSIQGDEIGVHRNQTIHPPFHYYGGQNIDHPRFQQDSITRGIRGEIIQNIHQGCLLHTYHMHNYYYYPSMPPHPICSFQYCTSSIIYAPYGVSNHPYISPFVYLYSPPQHFPPSSI